jgi:hypothetical protein
MKIQTVKDKSIPTPIKLNGVDNFLTSMVDSYCFWTITVVNIISLHFGEQGGTNLLLSVAMLGQWQAVSVTVATSERCHHLPIPTVNLKILYYFLVKFLHLYDMKYVNNLWVQIDTSAMLSYV